MEQPVLALTRRIRSTPFSRRVEEAGVKATVYNHMRLPAVFQSVEDDYRHLKTHVQLWDVADDRLKCAAGTPHGSCRCSPPRPSKTLDRPVLLRPHGG